MVVAASEEYSQSQLPDSKNSVMCEETAADTDKVSSVLGLHVALGALSVSGPRGLAWFLAIVSLVSTVPVTRGILVALRGDYSWSGRIETV